MYYISLKKNIQFSFEILHRNHVEYEVLTNFYKKSFPQFLFAKNVCTSLWKIIKTTKLPYLTILEDLFWNNIF